MKRNELNFINVLKKVTQGVKDFFFLDEDDVEYENLGNTIQFIFNEENEMFEFSYNKDYRIYFGHENKKEFFIANENTVIFHGEFLTREHIETFMLPENFGEGQIINYHYGRKGQNKYVFYELKGEKKEKNDYCYIVSVYNSQVGFELESYTSNKDLIKDAFNKLTFKSNQQ